LNNKLIISFFICVLIGVKSIQAQYNGGSGGSYNSTVITTTACTYTPDYTLLFYAGGNGGGYNVTQINTTTCTFPTITEYLIYAGGDGGGYDIKQIDNVTCSIPIITEYLIYSGGDGSGYINTQINNTNCPIPESSNFYLGSPITVGSSKGVASNTSSNNNGPYILAAASKYAIVKGDCVSLTTTGSGATTYVWTQSVGSDITNTNFQNTTARPTQNTEYTVTASGASTGCRNTSKVSIQVIDNGTTSITYPTSVCNSEINNQYQYPVLTGMTNGTFSISPSTGMTIDTKSGAIKTYSATTQTYVITYTYGSACSNTTTTSIAITNNCGTNAGVVTYTNMYKGGLSNSVLSSNYTTTVACAENPIIESKIYAGGLSNNIVSTNLNTTFTACPSNTDITSLIYAGGLSDNVISKNALQQQACIYPVGDNFYFGGTGAGYNKGLRTPTTGATSGTTVKVSADQTICPGGPITLTATGATNFTWTPATNLSSTIIANPIATPMTTTTYTVVGTGGVGCINTAKVKVTVLEDTYTTVSYGAYNFDETDMGLKRVNILGPFNGSFSASPAGLFYDQTSGSFTPGLSTSGVYAISYNYTKGSCNYTYVSNVNITTLPPIITYPSPSIFYINYAGIIATPTNTGGRVVAYEALDALPTGLTINATTGVISGTPTALVENASVRIRAYNYNRAGNVNYSDVFTMSISVRKPIISSTTASITSLNTTYGLASTTRTINVSGQYIIQNILLTVPNGFEVSSNASTGFANTLTLTASGGNIASTSAYIRLKANAGVGNFTGTVVLTSDAADNLSIPIATSYVAAGPLTVTATYFQKFYGSKITLTAGSRSFTSTGLMNGETIGSVTLSATSGTEANDAPGLYNVTPSAATGGTFSTSNYNIVYVPGQFQVLYSLYNFAMTGNSSNWVLGKVPIPKIAAGVISNLSYTSATFTSNISSSFSNIVQRGACWNTSINPTISNSKVIDGATTSGLMTSNLTGLAQGTIYYVRTFITIGGFTYYGPNVKFKTTLRDGLTAATASPSGVQLRTDFPSYTSGWYWIKSASMPNALQMYVDMSEDGGGYDFYIITAGPSVSYVNVTNGGTALGLDIVMPRSKGHWKAMSNAVLSAIATSRAGAGNYASFFQTTYGVYRDNGGSVSYTNKVMRSSSYGGSTNAADWKVKDGGKWWLRDAIFGEPNGDYTSSGFLGLHAGGYTFPNPYDYSDIGFNDGNTYATGNFYLVSTNAKP